MVDFDRAVNSELLASEAIGAAGDAWDITIEAMRSRINDIRELAAANANVKRYSYDSMTGLLRRDAFINRIDAIRQNIQANAAAGNGGHDAALMLMLDLRKLHKINNRGGQQAGDKVIVDTGTFLREFVAPEDRMNSIGGRLGGDEFALLVSFNQSELSLEEVQEIIFTRLNNFGLDSTPYGLRVGAMALSTPEKSAIDLFREADPKAPVTLRQKLGKNVVNLAYSAGLRKVLRVS